MVGIPTPIDTSSLNRRIAALESAINAMAGARTLSAATISEGGLTIRDGGGLTIREGGNVTIRDGGDVTIGEGGELHVDGLATFGGDMKVTGTLSLPAGIIDNDALANPLTFGEAGGDADGFSIPTAMTTIATASITVPAGFTRGLVIASGAAVGFNGTANKIGINARVFIRSPTESYGRLLSADTSADNRLVALSPMKQDVLSGLTPGLKIHCDIRMSAATALAAAGFNGASINAYAIFQR